ncbi:hypothetical protein COC42_16650 [Sphingomonas spermidinifaciens]|uniref:Glycoside hydrolase family 5 domain-containing protein n=2 Tax=Sphingomonas spermidinifaciens TaxID=1141889 RepID=A0A2A4AZZ2_9SPHN|nr:hypothetical protein COC42_16650 [Sphingomonas spermidinifaciens]
MRARPAPLIVGVATHFGIGGEYGYDIDKSARAIAEIGFDSFRDDLGWQWFDTHGQQPLPRLSQFIKATRARPLIILGAEYPDRADLDPPLTPAARQAYAKFTAAAAQLPELKGAMFEIGNEWNLRAAKGRPLMQDAGQAGDPRAATAYVPAAIAGARAVRSAQPGATVLVGAAGIDPGWKWISAVSRSAAPAATGVSAHYYNQCEPGPRRTGDDTIRQIERLHTSLAGPSGKAPPIYVTEFGWPTARNCPVSRDQAANNAAQFILWAGATPWLRGVWIYQLKDQGRDPVDIEANFGIYDYDYRPKPAACLVRESIAIVRAMKGASVQRGPMGTMLVLTRGASGRRLIAWTGDVGAQATLAIRGQPSLTAQPLCGQPGRGATAALGNRPVVIDLPPGDNALQLTVG